MKRSHIAAIIGIGACAVIAGAYAAYYSPQKAYGEDIPTEIDVFLVAGQSNAVGDGDPALASIPPAGMAYQYFSATVTPVTNTVLPGRGGAWPAFAKTYVGLTGKKIGFVNTAVGGTAQANIPVATQPHWDDNGTLFDASVQKANVALAAFEAAGFTPVFKGVLWVQGEADAYYIRRNEHTALEYKNALVRMISKYRTAFGSEMPFYIFETGNSMVHEEAAFAAVRQMQEEVAMTDPHTHIAFRGAVTFLWRDLMHNTYHYTQKGYNEMGQVAARNVYTLITKPRAPKSPTPSLVPGEYFIPGSVTLSSIGASFFRYTINGANPTCTTGNPYDGSISITTTGIIHLKAVACSSTSKPSLVADIPFKFEEPAPTPAAAPEAGAYTGKISITLSAPGADSIRYSLRADRIPNCLRGDPYTDPITIKTSKTLYTVACKNGIQSPLQIFDYSIIPTASTTAETISDADVERTEEVETNTGVASTTE